MIQFHCYGCSKPVSSPLPDDAVLRAIAWCADCITEGKDQSIHFTEEEVRILKRMENDAPFADERAVFLRRLIATISATTPEVKDEA